MRILAAFFGVALASFAQDPPSAPPQPQGPPVLENSGKPMVVPYQCTAEDVQLAGLTCSEDEPCPVYLELAAVASSGIRLFTAGNIHTATATLFSVVLASEDNGHTWREGHERVRGAGYDSAQFADTDSGWISGLTLAPLPQDPFFLRTTDGGKTWRNSPMFSETHYGSIQQFLFTDKTSGALIIDRGSGSGSDRYERYESQDGGDSWTLKETSVKPLTLKRQANAPPAEWRVRADANSRSFQIEHRQGSRWSSVASFAVNLGACRPQ